VRFSPGWERRTRTGLAYELSYAYQGVAYNPSIGFTNRYDFSSIGRSISYAWMPAESSPIYRHSAMLFFWVYFRNEDGAPESVMVGPSWSVEWKSGGRARVSTRFNYEDLPDTLNLPEDTFVPPNAYSFLELDISYQMPWAKLLRTGIDLETGPFYDGWYMELGVSPSWTISRFFSLLGRYQFTRARFPDRDQRFDTHLLSLRLLARMNTTFSANVFVQYNSAVDAIGINSRLRYNPREGTDFYLVFNEGLNTDRHREAELLQPLTSSRTILLKYSRTFLPRLSWTTW